MAEYGFYKNTINYYSDFLDSGIYKTIRSPFFYVGDKYKLMPQLKKFFTHDIDLYIEPFVGGGSSFLNVEAKKYFLNDNNFYLIALHNFLITSKKEYFLNTLFYLIEKYNFSCSLCGKVPPLELRQAYKRPILQNSIKKLI